jgi:excisionase family DNA binding protein
MNDEPALYRITDACRRVSCGTTKLYELIATGVLDARKAGRCTRITAESLDLYIANLPPATIGTGQKPS